MTDWNRINQAIDQQLEASISMLSRLVAVPSVAARGEHMDDGANLVADLLRQRDFEAQVLPSDGFPVVYGFRKGRADRTLLLYNHYDVQPPEPLDLWESPPFEATHRGGKLYGRGVADDKGHIACRLAAIDALLSVEGELPCSVKFVIEGEEEIGSIHLPKFIADHRDLLAGDACLWEFGDVEFDGVPVQYAGLRGILYIELTVRTATRDAHSGVGGSIFPNAAWRLTWALASLKGPDERVLIPGFYDRVQPPTARDLELLEKLPEVADDYRRSYGLSDFLKGLTGGIELRREGVFAPSCTICGLTSGYQGPGVKTVLPALASAKVEFRLVADQEPEEIKELLRKHLDDRGFRDVMITYSEGEPPGQTNLDDPFLQMVVETARPVYGMPMRINPMIGGSGPNHAFLHILGVPVATAGVGDQDSQAHAPNENVDLDLFRKGVEHTARIIVGFSELGR